MSDDDIPELEDDAGAEPWRPDRPARSDGLTQYLERKKTCPLKPLGHFEGRYFFLSPGGELRIATGREMGKLGLTSLVDGDVRWFFSHFPADKGFNADIAAAFLMRECSKAGLWDPNTPLRGCGTWRAGARAEDGLLVHVGNELSVNGRPQPTGVLIHGVIYPSRPAIERPADVPASRADGAQLLEGAKNWQFKSVAGPDLFVGWIGQAFYGGAAPWRSHLYVNAKWGSGKTWLADYAQAALGGAAHQASNDYTEAGLRQALTNEARAIILDEAEGGEGRAQIGAVIEMIRRMSSGRGARTMRGSADGGARAYNVTGSALMTSILPAPLKPQDRSRITLLQLDPLLTGPEAHGADNRATAAIIAAREMSPRLWARAIASWDRFLATFAAYRTVLMDRDAAAREADQMATLLAGRDVLIYDDMPSDARKEAALAMLADIIAEARDDASIGEGEQCLVYLLTSASGIFQNNRDQAIGEMIGTARKPGGEIERRDLERLGLRVVPGEYVDGRGDVLHVANDHAFLNKLFGSTREGARWSRGNYRTALRYLPGACASEHRFAGLRFRATAIGAAHLPSHDPYIGRDDEGAGGT